MSTSNIEWAFNENISDILGSNYHIVFQYANYSVVTMKSR